jgi:hypothetical protein
MVITILYYLLTAWVAFLIVLNFIRAKKWQDEVLIMIILIPFLLRLLRLK